MKFAVAINMERFDPGRRMDDVTREVLHLVQMADRGGFETAWAAEHHTIESIIGPNPLTMLIWWAQHTERIRLGAATVVAPYWNPIRLAGEAALCDHLTGGRLELGIGRGAFQYEFDRMAGGIPQQEGVAYLKELLPAVRRLWAGDYAHEGRYWQFPLSTSVPKPKQQPAPPIWIAARDPGTYDWAIANGAHILSTPLSAPPAEVLSLGEKFRKAVADHPEVPRPRFMMQRRTCVYARKIRLGRAGPPQQRVRAAVREPVPECRRRHQRLPRGDRPHARRQQRELRPAGHPAQPAVRHARRDHREAAGLSGCGRRPGLDQHQLRPAVRDAEDLAAAVHRRGDAGLRAAGKARAAAAGQRRMRSAR